VAKAKHVYRKKVFSKGLLMDTSRITWRPGPKIEVKMKHREAAQRTPGSSGQGRKEKLLSARGQKREKTGREN